MRKIMILTASTGEGHNQAAKSLEAVYKASGYEVIIVDFLKETGKVVEKVVVDGSSFLYSNLPYIYNDLYKYCNNQGFYFKVISYALKIFERKIYKRIIEESPDLIIGTHAFTVNIICNLKKKRYLSIPFISVITDFMAHRLHINSYVDAFITASEFTRLDMIKRGVSREKVFPYGIPIKQDFLEKRFNEKHKGNKVFTILLMSGGIGSGSVESVLSELINCRNPLKIIVVCGRNEELMNSIKSKYSSMVENEEILLYSFTNEIPKLMKEADLLISKPGGLTASEAIASNIPMLIPYMLPGQEEENAAFLVESGAAKVIENISSLKTDIDYLIERPYILKRMKINMNELSTGYSLSNLGNIVKLSDRLINDYLGIRIPYNKVKYVTN